MPEKYRDEIEEILRKAGGAAPSRPPPASERHLEDRPREPIVSRRAPASDYRPRPRRPTITPGKMMLAGVVLFLIGIKFWPLIWVGLAMLVGAYMPMHESLERRPVHGLSALLRFPTAHFLRKEVAWAARGGDLYLLLGAYQRLAQKLIGSPEHI